MRRIIFLVILFAAAGLIRAQDIRTERTSAPTVYDAKANSDSVPEVYAVAARFERVAVIRLKYKADLLAGLEKAVKESNIRNGVILAGTGSVISYHYHVVSNTGFPTKNIFVKNDDAPADLVSMNGYIVGGRVHAHATFTNTEKAFGGHLEPGTTVFTFAIVTVGVMSDSTGLSRIDDKNYR